MEPEAAHAKPGDPITDRNLIFEAAMGKTAEKRLKIGAATKKNV